MPHLVWDFKDAIVNENIFFSNETNKESFLWLHIKICFAYQKRQSKPEHVFLVKDFQCDFYLNFSAGEENVKKTILLNWKFCYPFQSV